MYNTLQDAVQQGFHSTYRSGRRFVAVDRLSTVHHISLPNGATGDGSQRSLHLEFVPLRRKGILFGTWKL